MTRRRLLSLSAALAAVVVLILVPFLRLPKMTTLNELIRTITASTPTTVVGPSVRTPPTSSAAQVPSSTVSTPSTTVGTTARPSTSTPKPVTASAPRPVTTTTPPKPAPVTTAAPKMIVVPNVVGDDKVTADQTLAEAGLGATMGCGAGTQDPSYVESQSPPAGSTIPALNPATNTGNDVALTFYCGPAPTTTTTAATTTTASADRA